MLLMIFNYACLALKNIKTQEKGACLFGGNGSANIGGRRMKKPTVEMIDVSLDCKSKKFVERSYCPQCGEETSRFYFLKYNEGDIEPLDVDVEENAIHIDPDEISLLLTEYIYGKQFELDSPLFLEPLHILKHIFKSLHFKSKANEGFYPYFCSKECVNKFIKKQLDKIVEDNG